MITCNLRVYDCIPHCNKEYGDSRCGSSYSSLVTLSLPI